MKSLCYCKSGPGRQARLNPHGVFQNRSGTKLVHKWYGKAAAVRYNK